MQSSTNADFQIPSHVNGHASWTYQQGMPVVGSETPSGLPVHNKAEPVACSEILNFEEEPVQYLPSLTF